jgi:carbon monoxide dehydrogenase subunit G
MKFELKHTFDAPVDQVMEAMTDPAFPEFMKSHMKLMSDIKPVERKENGGQLSWKLRCVPVPMIKKVGPKEVPPEALAFVQESTIDRAAKRISFKNVAEHEKVKKHLENSGSFTFRDVGGRTERVISGELKVTNLPFLLKPLAAVAERIIYSNAEDLLNEEAKVFGEFLKTRKPTA